MDGYLFPIVFKKMFYNRYVYLLNRALDKIQSITLSG